MRSSFDCGPAAELDILNRLGVNISYEELIKKWGFPKRAFLGNLRDSPGAHWRILRSLGVPWKLITLQDILENNFKPDFTMVLVHLPENPWFYQHWTIVHKVTDKEVFLHWGLADPIGSLNPAAPKKFSRQEFVKLYADGSPACAFIVGEGSTDWTWEMSWDLFLSILLYIPSKI